MRIHHLPGALNLRDFGGHTTSDGRQVRPGLLFRSGMLSGFSGERAPAFLELGVGTICDLRRDAERAADPTPFPEHDPLQVHIPIDPGSAIAMRAALEDAELDLADRIAFMVGINRELAREHADDYRRMFDALLDAPRGFLVHCSAGKDRTGFAVMLVQEALGVPRDAIERDYLVTNEVIDVDGVMIPRIRSRYDRPLPPREWIMALAGVRPEYLAAAYDEMAARHGDPQGYLRDAIGLTDAERTELRARFLTDGAPT